MDNIFGTLLNILLIYIIIRSVLILFKKPTSQPTDRQTNHQKREVPVEKVVIEMVKDEICGRSIPRAEAHIMVKNNEKHFFCSWDCREKSLEPVVQDS